jgi:hypothetical protein
VETLPDQIPIRVETGFLPGKTITVRMTASDGTVLDEKQIKTSSISSARSGEETTLHLKDSSIDEFELVVLYDGEVVRRHSVFDGPAPILRNLTARRVEAGIAVSATVRVPDEGLLLVERVGKPDATVPVPEDELVQRTIVIDESDFDKSGTTRVTVVWKRNSVRGSNRGNEVFPSIGFREISLPEETATPTQTQEVVRNSTSSATPSTTVGTAGFGLGQISLLGLTLFAYIWKRFNSK